MDQWQSKEFGELELIRNWGRPCKELDILADIKKKRLEWVGHVVRMDQGVNQSESKPE
jgi:hypothetical protein